MPLSDVLEAMDVKNLFSGCDLGLKYCSVSNPCLLHHEFKVIRNKIQRMLKNTSIADFNDDLNRGMKAIVQFIELNIAEQHTIP